MKWTNKEIETRKTLRAQGQTLNQVARALGRTPDSIWNAINRYMLLQDLQPKVRAEAQPESQTAIPVEVAKSIQLPKPEFGRLPLDLIDSGGWVRLGLVVETHLACKEERLAELHTEYDLFAAEGITRSSMPAT